MFSSQRDKRHVRPHRGSTRNAFRPALESCEPRRLMAAGITAGMFGTELHVNGTDKADVITLRQVGTQITVDGVKATFKGVLSVRIDAGKGNDQIFLSPEISQTVSVRSDLFGGPGNDTIFGGSAQDHVFGGPGNDVIWGQGGGDNLYGDDDNDFLLGMDGPDTLKGGAGDDTLLGGAGNDYLDSGNSAKDKMVGEDGVDTFRRWLEPKASFGARPTDPNDDPNFVGPPDAGNENSKTTPPTEIVGSFLTSPRFAMEWHVIQQSTDTCAFLATLASVARTSKLDLASQITYEEVGGWYNVPIFVRGARTTQQVFGSWTEGNDPSGPLWVTLYQRAYLQALGVKYRDWSRDVGDFFLPAKDWKAAGSDPTAFRKRSVALEALTGQKPQVLATSKVTIAQLRDSLAKGQNVVIGTLDKGVATPLVENHAYAVTAVSASGVVTLRNPWGIDGRGGAIDGKNDGVLTVNWKTFQKNVSDVAIG